MVSVETRVLTLYSLFYQSMSQLDEPHVFFRTLHKALEKWGFCTLAGAIAHHFTKHEILWMAWFVHKETNFNQKTWVLAMLKNAYART